MPYHILARKEDIASRAVVVGDPGRAKLLSELLDSPRLVNENRGLLTYTGKWRGVEVTVSTHGMGGPGAAIIFEELIELGVEVMVRFGSTGGIRRGVKVGDLVIPTGAHYYPGGLSLMYFGEKCVSAVPSYDVLSTLVSEAKKAGARVWVAPVLSSDGFYAETRELIEEWARIGAVSVEMECATLFLISNLRGIKSGALLFVNGSHVEPVERIVPEEELREMFRKTGEIVLNAIIKIEDS